MPKYDLVILGCGPSGEKAAAQAAYFGKTVAITDSGKVGGACVHTGTLPSKGLRESALAMARLAQLGLKGVTCTLAEDVRVDELLAHKDAVCNAEEARILQNLKRHNVDLYYGHAAFSDPHTVTVQQHDGTSVDLQGDIIVIATGTSPHRPANIEFDQELIWDSDEVVSMAAVPHTLAVYGAGVIGCEYASMFAVLGVKVHLVEPRDAILPFVDQDITAELLKSFERLHVEMHTNARYTRCEVVGNQVEMDFDDGRKLVVDRVLYAAGRSGNTKNLGLEKIGLAANKRGLMDVNEHFQTSLPHIYAVGDVIGFPALASTGMDQGRVAMCHAFQFEYKKALGRWLPYGIYTIPECGMVGANEQELRAAGKDFEVGIAYYKNNARAQLVGTQEGLLKILFDPKDKSLLGIHCVGERASELVHIGMTALQCGGGLDTFIDAVYNYPTLSELFKYAAYDGLARLAARKKPSNITPLL